MLRSQAHGFARVVWLALATLAMLALCAGRAESQAAAPAAGIPAGCTYAACALRLEPGFAGVRVVRGATGERVSTLGGFGGGTAPLLAGPDSAAFHARRFTRSQRWATVLGLAAAGVGVWAWQRGDGDGGGNWFSFDSGDDTRTVLVFVGAGLSFASVPFAWRAQQSASRSVWWYNAALPR